MKLEVLASSIRAYPLNVRKRARAIVKVRWDKERLLRPDTRKRLKRLPPASRRRVLVAAQRLIEHGDRRLKWANSDTPTMTYRELAEYVNLIRPELSRRLNRATYRERRETAEAAAEFMRLIEGRQ